MNKVRYWLLFLYNCLPVGWKLGIAEVNDVTMVIWVWHVPYLITMPTKRGSKKVMITRSRLVHPVSHIKFCKAAGWEYATKAPIIGYSSVVVP